MIFVAFAFLVVVLLMLVLHVLYRILWQLRSDARTRVTLFNAYAAKNGLPEAHFKERS